MRPTGITRFVILGAVGFGVGAAITILSMLVPIPLSVLVGGVAGGASLGLALKDLRKAAVLAILGALGLAVGIFAALAVGSSFNYSPIPMGAMVGTVVGAVFLDWRTILALGMAGAVGFGVGLLAGDLLRASVPIIRRSIIVAGALGGASLGAALGYLECLTQTESLRPTDR